MKKFGIKFEEKGGKFYSEIIPQKELKSLLLGLKKAKARFITATALKNGGKDINIYYHFEINDRVFTIKTGLNKEKAVSISKNYPNSAWIEREIQEFYKIDFTGQIKKPLLYSG